MQREYKSISEWLNKKANLAAIERGAQPTETRMFDGTAAPLVTAYTRPFLSQILQAYGTHTLTRNFTLNRPPLTVANGPQNTDPRRVIRPGGPHLSGLSDQKRQKWAELAC